jgi:predicted esterase
MLTVTTSCIYFSQPNQEESSWVSSSTHRLKVHILNPSNLKHAEILAVYLHGDTPGEEGEYMLHAASQISLPNLVSAAIIRPGYRNSDGDFSSGSTNGEVNNYSVENIKAILEVTLKLKEKFQAKKVILVGHSGGSAIAANLAGLHNRAIDGLVLISCPCDLQAWHPDWTESLSPLNFVHKYSKNINIIALTGKDDDVTPPYLAESFISALKKQGLTHVELRIPQKMGHNFIIKRPEVIDAINKVIELSAGNDEE